MATPGQGPVEGEPEYGDKVATAEQQAAVPQEETPLTEPIMSSGPAAAAPMQPQGQMAPPATTRNSMLRLPPEVLFAERRQKTPIEKQYDAGMLWEVLAADPTASRTIRTIARELKGS